jgi:hypothetical protein
MSDANALFVPQQDSRNRADGSIITQYCNVWIVTWQDGRLGIRQRSS